MDNVNSQGELNKSETNDEAPFDLESMDPEQRQKIEEELKTELIKVSVKSHRSIISTVVDIAH